MVTGRACDPAPAPGPHSLFSSVRLAGAADAPPLLLVIPHEIVRPVVALVLAPVAAMSPAAILHPFPPHLLRSAAAAAAAASRQQRLRPLRPPLVIRLPCLDQNHCLVHRDLQIGPQPPPHPPLPSIASKFSLQTLIALSRQIQFGIFPCDGLQRELRGTLFLVLGVFGLRLGFSLAPLRSISRPKPLVFWGFLFWPFQRVESTESSLERIKRQLTSGSGRYLLQGPLLKRSETVWLLGSLVVLEIHVSKRYNTTYDLLRSLVEHFYTNPKSSTFDYLDEKPVDTSLIKFSDLCPSTLSWAVPLIGAIFAPLPPEIDRRRSISGDISRGREKEEEGERFLESRALLFPYSPALFVARAIHRRWAIPSPSVGRRNEA
ncbi:hypothetical protein B296_00051093, partial [Ensete ventricosum]